jgi:hypothetical protein
LLTAGIVKRISIFRDRQACGGEIINLSANSCGDRKRLLVIEPNLRNPSGHYAEFVRATGSRLRDEALEVFAHPDADAMLAQMPGVAVHCGSPRVGDFLAEWRTIGQCQRQGRPFLLLTADGRHAAAASLFALLPGSKPRRSGFFFHRAPTTWRDWLLYPLTGAARESSLAVTATEQVAKVLKELGWKRVRFVPYPAIGAEVQPQPRPFSHLLMAGAARLNKGLDLVTGLACDWAAAGRTLPLFVQVSQKHAAKHGSAEEQLVAKLLASGYSGLVTAAAPPDRAEYVRRFAGALVLAPYAREQFADQVSGVVLDALLHGSPVIATGGTWPAAMVERFGAGLTIEERSPAALAAAVDRILASWDSYSARACEAAAVLSREHDPANLLRVLAEEGIS